MSAYKVTDINDPLNERIIEAATVEIEESTNATLFKDSEGNLVARLYNVNFEPATEE